MAEGPLERFWDNVSPCPITGCWYWMGYLSQGYGYIRVNGRRMGAHRFAWEMQYGPIPEGYVIDHFKCDNPTCVNPEHLRPVTQRENILRGNGTSAFNASKGHCPKCGDPYVYISNGQRRCRKCKNEINRRYAARKRGSK